MPLGRHPDGLAHQVNQKVSGFYGITVRTGLISPASIVDFPCSYSRKADARAFGAPYGPIPVSKPNRGASKRLTDRYDGGSHS